MIHMKKLLMPLLINLYLIQTSLELIYDNGAFDTAVLITWILVILAVILAFINIGYAIFCIKGLSENTNQLETASHTILLMKILTIPFYIFYFILWLFTSGYVIWGLGELQMFFLLVPKVIGFTYLMFVSFSSYSISLLLALRKNGKLTVPQFVTHTICQLVFVVDVLDSVDASSSQHIEPQSDTANLNSRDKG